LLLEEVYAINAQLAADAGLDDAISKINTVSGWTGTGGQTTLLNDTTRNVKTTYEVLSTATDSTHKTLTVTARTFSPTTASTH
jgi:hypothetical protein